MNISYSAIKKFLDCPHQWYAQYFLGYKQPYNAAASIGSRVHELIETNGRGTPLETPLEEHEAQRMYKEIVGDVEQLLVGDVHKEEWVSMPFGAHKILAKIDVFIKNNNHIRVIDFKTGKWYNEDPLQLKFYSWLLWKNNPKYTNYKAMLYYLRLNKKYEIELDKDELKRFDKYIMDVIHRMLMYNPNEPQFKIGNYCQWCPYSKECPAIKGGNKNE